MQALLQSGIALIMFVSSQGSSFRSYFLFKILKQTEYYGKLTVVFSLFTHKRRQELCLRRFEAPFGAEGMRCAEGFPLPAGRGVWRGGIAPP